MTASDRRLIAIAAGICAILLPIVPYGQIVVYPLSLLVTSLHEMGHALAAILTGGSVHSIVINPDTSGVTVSSGSIRFVTASAGYVGSTLFGCILLVLAQRGRWHRLVLGGLLLWFIAFTALFARNWLALLLGVVMVVLIGLLAKHVRSAHGALYFLLDFVALSSCLYAFKDIMDLVRVSTGMAMATGNTDAQTLQGMTGIPAVVWAVGWGLVSLAAAWLSMRLAWRLADDGAPSDDILARSADEALGL